MRIPLRFRNGEAEKLEDGSDDYFAQLLALTTQILPGELPLNPNYGVDDPTFDETARRQLAFLVGAFIPEITLERVAVLDTVSGRSRVDIAFTVRT